MAYTTPAVAQVDPRMHLFYKEYCFQAISLSESMCGWACVFVWGFVYVFVYACISMIVEA